MTDKTEWQGRVGRAWAAEWRRTDRGFTGLTDALLARAGVHPFRRALDLGCGAGELSLALARAHGGAELVGLDISEELIAAAKARGGQLANVAFHCADAATWDHGGYAPDLIVSRHGVMFFDDPPAAFAHLGRIAAPHARMIFSCFRDLAENPWAERVIALLPPGTATTGDPYAPGPFAFADRRHVEAILQRSGWAAVHHEQVDFAYILGMGDDAVEDAVSYLLAIGPAARAARDLCERDRAAFADRLRGLASANLDHGLVAMRAGAWIVSAHRGD